MIRKETINKEFRKISLGETTLLDSDCCPIVIEENIPVAQTQEVEE